jgi:cell division transport system permease protein
MTALSVLSIAFSLLMAGAFGLTAHNIDVALEDVEERVQVVAYLGEDVPSRAVELARSEIGSYPEVEEVRYVSKVEALRNASRELPEFSDVFSALEVNPLPASLEIRLVPAARNPSGAREVAARVSGYAFVEEVRAAQEWVEQIYSLRRMAAAAALLLGGAFAVAAVLLVGSMVRMAVLSRREEIAVMESVGATDAYMRRPFLVEGGITGLGGGLLALVLTYGLYLLADQTFLGLAWIPPAWALGLPLAGMALGVGAAARSVQKEIRGQRVV